MITTFKINDILYPIINITSVKATIGEGRVYRVKKPLNSEKQDIIILPLSNYVGSEILNDSVFIINCYCKNFTDGTPDITLLRATTKAVADAIEIYNNKNNYYIFDVTSQILLQDTDQISMSYASLRIQCYIEK